jgi:outer membrane protein assembly factor BamD (BamD/ComL family)
MTHSTHELGRRSAKSWAGFFGAAAMLALCCLAVNPRLAHSAEKDKGQQISRVIAKEMTAAQKALQAGQWAEAIKNLDAALTKSPLTPFDEASIYRFHGFANIKLNNLKAAQVDYEKAFATGALSSEDKTQMQRTLFTIAATTSQYQKTIDYGKEMTDAGTATPNDVAIMAQSYYQLKDCKNAAVWADKAVAAARKAGEAPKENLYLFKLQCASDAGDNAAMVPVLSDLIRLNNKSTYWNTLLRIERQDERDDHNTLMIYRIMYDTGSMTVGTDYIEMAQLLGDAGLPGEAQTTLEKAMSAGLINDQQKERTTRLLNSFKARAETDKKSQAQFDAEATKNPAGELDVKLGEVYYGSGDYQNAVTAINRGLQKGQIKHPDEAYVYLGRAQVQLKNFADAKKAFAGVKSVPKVSPRVSKLYDLYGDTVGR